MALYVGLWFCEMWLSLYYHIRYIMFTVLVLTFSTCNIDHQFGDLVLPCLFRHFLHHCDRCLSSVQWKAISMLLLHHHTDNIDMSLNISVKDSESIYPDSALPMLSLELVCIVISNTAPWFNDCQFFNNHCLGTHPYKHKCYVLAGTRRSRRSTDMLEHTIPLLPLFFHRHLKDLVCQHIHGMIYMYYVLSSSASCCQ